MKEAKYQPRQRFLVSRIHVFLHASKITMKHKMNHIKFGQNRFHNLFCNIKKIWCIWCFHFAVVLSVGSLTVRKWVHCALCQIFLRLCMLESIGVNWQKTKRPKMDNSNGLICRPDRDDIISFVRFGPILVKQL